MNKGQLIYRDQTAVSFFYVILVLLIAFWVLYLFLSSRTLTFGDIQALLFLTFVFGGVSYLCFKTAKNNSGLYECGIGYFENNKLVRFESYEMFLSVECCFRRRHSSFKAESDYVLIFHHSDGSSVEITQNSVQSLKKIWKPIVLQNPTIVRRLTIYEPSTSDSRLKFGNLKPHRASELLFEVLKNVQYENQF